MMTGYDRWNTPDVTERWNKAEDLIEALHLNGGDIDTGLAIALLDARDWDVEAAKKAAVEPTPL